jgi:hypothetical protein
MRTKNLIILLVLLLIPLALADGVCCQFIDHCSYEQNKTSCETLADNNKISKYNFINATQDECAALCTPESSSKWPFLLFLVLGVIAYFVWKHAKKKHEPLQQNIPDYLVPWHESEEKVKNMHNKFKKKMKERKRSQQLHELGIKQQPRRIKSLKRVIRNQKRNKMKQTDKTFEELQKRTKK